MTIADWIGVYGAALSSLIAVVAAVRWALAWRKHRLEREKVQIFARLLTKVDKSSGRRFHIGNLIVANLGENRVAFKGLEYEGFSNGMRTTGSMGWYEQPEELFGIHNRLLPLVLESGQTADLPMVELGYLRIDGVRIWLTDFDDHKHYLTERELNQLREEVKRRVPEQTADTA